MKILQFLPEISFHHSFATSLETRRPLWQCLLHCSLLPRHGSSDSASCRVCGLWSDQLVDVELMCGVGAR